MNEEKVYIDKEKIKNQVKNEILAEEKYWLQNSAKLRAVEQRVPTYEDFRQMVLASHLRPLDKGESIRDNKNKLNLWNSHASSSNQDINYENLLKQSNQELQQKMSILDSKPKSSLEFTKIWKLIEDKRDDELKWNFLTSLGVDSIKDIFRVEINGELLGKFLTLFELKLNHMIENEEQLDKELMTKELNLIFELLECFPQCNRFKLNLMFLKESEIKSLKKIIDFFNAKANLKANKLTFYELSDKCAENLNSCYLK